MFPLLFSIASNPLALVKDCVVSGYICVSIPIFKWNRHDDEADLVFSLLIILQNFQLREVGFNYHVGEPCNKLFFNSILFYEILISTGGLQTILQLLESVGMSLGVCFGNKILTI